MKKDLLKIINEYGVLDQLKYFQSEVFELNEAIIRYIEGDENYFDCKDDKEMREHIKEEIADVLCMLRQFQYYYKFKDDEIDSIVEYKVNRQLERMKNKYSKGD